MRAAATGPLRATIVGTVAGSALAVAAGRLLAGVLFGIAPSDPPALLFTAAVIAAVIAASTIAPVRRALRVAPMSILRL